MNYKIYLYAITVIISSYALSGLNFDAFMKKNKPIEARILVILLSCGLGYLVANFIYDFLNITSLF